MTRMDLMSSLPVWAQNNAARKLLYSILADRPDWFLRRYDSGYGGEIVYKGKQGGPVARLKRLHSDWFDAELAKLDARWNAGETPTREESPCKVEDANRLIHRLLREADEVALVEVEHLGPGRIAA